MSLHWYPSILIFFDQLFPQDCSLSATLSMEVSYTFHSHPIGKSGKNILSIGTPSDGSWWSKSPRIVATLRYLPMRKKPTFRNEFRNEFSFIASLCTVYCSTIHCSQINNGRIYTHFLAIARPFSSGWCQQRIFLCMLRDELSLHMSRRLLKPGVHFALPLPGGPVTTFSHRHRQRETCTCSITCIRVAVYVYYLW